MLSNAHHKGASDALTHFKVAGVLDAVKRMAIGEAGQAFVQGPKAFAPGGVLHWRNVFWPSQYGRMGNWVGRAGTLAMIPAAMGAISQPDPNEGRLSHTLGTLGNFAGAAYGGMGGGLVGGSLGATLGGRLGHGIGHALGSRPQQSQDPYQ